MLCKVGTKNVVGEEKVWKVGETVAEGEWTWNERTRATTQRDLEPQSQNVIMAAVFEIEFSRDDDESFRRINFDLYSNQWISYRSYFFLEIFNLLDVSL